MNHGHESMQRSNRDECVSFDLAFVIVSYNSADDLRQCIASIGAFFPSDHKYSTVIVIVDNASMDGSQEIITELQQTHSGVISVMQDVNIGFGPANNVAFRSVSARYYVLINADAWLIADSITQVLLAMDAKTDIAVCGLPLIYPDGSPQTCVFNFSSWKRWLLQMIGVRTFVVKMIRFPLLSKVLQRLPYGQEFVRNQSSAAVDVAHIDTSVYSNTVRDVD